MIYQATGGRRDNSPIAQNDRRRHARQFGARNEFPVWVSEIWIRSVAEGWIKIRSHNKLSLLQRYRCFTLSVIELQ